MKSINIKILVNYIKLNKKRSTLIVFLIFVIPLIIVHLLFKWVTSCDIIRAEWSAGELINYIAGFEAFVGTIILGIVAIWQTEKANITNDKLLEVTRENERRSVLPFLSINTYITSYEKFDLFNTLRKYTSVSELDKNIEINDVSVRTDTLLKELYFTIKESKIDLKNKLTEDQNKKISVPYGINIEKNSTKCSAPNYHFKKMFIQNCGRGAAINLKCRIYKCGFEEIKDFDLYSIPFTVAEGNNFNIGLFLNTEEDIQGSYFLVFLYQDIYANKYSQTIPIVLKKNDYELDIYQPQVEL